LVLELSELVAATSVVDYLNSFAGAAEHNDDFATGIEFQGGVEAPLGDAWGVKAEYAYLFTSYSFMPTYGGSYTFFYGVHMPTLLAHYVVGGTGYFVKLGGGIGYHAGAADERSTLYGTEKRYRTSGIGVKLEAVGQTAFDEHLFGTVGGYLRWDFLGTLKSGDGQPLARQGKAVSLDLFAASVVLGLAYYF
jgi:hypothetical protein